MTDFIPFLRGMQLLGYLPSVTSWLRSDVHNQKVGGVLNSLHLTGDAIDVVWDSAPELTKLHAVCVSHGLYLIREKDHDHIEAR